LFLSDILDRRIDKYGKYPYNPDVEKAPNDFEKEYGITWAEIT
jgi:hypothetical protein